MTDAIQRVEAFISRVHSLEYLIDEKARFVTVRGKDSNEATNLAAILIEAMDTYERNSNQETAIDCLYYINGAFTSGVVKEGPGSAKKLRECQEENSKLKDKIAQLETQLEILSAQYHALKEKHPSNGDDYLTP